MVHGLGRFGDERLEKGGSFCWAAWLAARVERGSKRLAVIVRVRSAWDGSCIIRR